MHILISRKNRYYPTEIHRNSRVRISLDSDSRIRFRSRKSDADQIALDDKIRPDPIGSDVRFDNLGRQPFIV